MSPGSVRRAVLSVIVVASTAAHAAPPGPYRWIDERGVVHYSQFPPPAPATPPAPAPEERPSPAPGAKPSPAPETTPSPPAAAPEATPSPGVPLSPRHERAIRELVQTAAGSGVTDPMLQQIALALVPSLRPWLERQLGRRVSPAEERKLVDVIRRTFVSVFPSALFEHGLVGVYAKYFNETEAEELVRFYRTPIGSKAARLAAAVAGEGAAIGQRLAKSREAEFAQRLREELAREFSP